MRKGKCHIVRDLLPLYEDNMISEKTIKYVDNHLKMCDDCRTYFKKLSSMDCVIKDKRKDKYIKKVNIFGDIPDIFKSALERNLSKCIMAALLVIIFLYCIMCKMRIFTVSNDNLQYKCYMVENKGLAIQLIAKDNKLGGMLYIDDSEEDSIYMTVKRTLLTNKKEYNAEDTYFYFVDTSLVKKVYLGTPKNSKLIWSYDINDDEIEFVNEKDYERIFFHTNREYHEMYVN